MFRRIAVGCAGTLALLAACHDSQPSARLAPQPLSPSEAAAVVGGVSVDITYPANNTAQTYDNLRFTANVTSLINDDPSYVSLWADATKVGSTTMNFTGSETRVLDQRVSWPFPGNFDAQFKYFYDDQYWEAEDDSFRSDQRVHSSVKVRPIHFWNVRQGSALPAVSSSFHAARVDSTDVARDNLANNIDGIFAQCGGNDRTQFRGNGTSNLTPSYDPPGTYNCSDLGELVTNECSIPAVCGQNNVGSCAPLLSCLEALASAAVDFDDDAGYISAHVFNVESTLCGELGRNITLTAGGVSRSFAIVSAGMAGNATNYTKLVAHELTHDTILHCNEDGGAGAGCVPADCSSASASVRNLMCTFGAGRVLTAAQCDMVKNFRWSDRN